jgi:hypothetical protein
VTASQATNPDMQNVHIWTTVPHPELNLKPSITAAMRA